MDQVIRRLSQAALLSFNVVSAVSPFPISCGRELQTKICHWVSSGHIYILFLLLLFLSRAFEMLTSSKQHEESQQRFPIKCHLIIAEHEQHRIQFESKRDARSKNVSTERKKRKKESSRDAFIHCHIANWHFWLEHCVDCM